VHVQVFVPVEHPALVRAIDRQFGFLNVGDDEIDSLFGILKRPQPTFHGCNHKIRAQFGIAPHFIGQTVKAVFQEIQSVIREKKCIQFLRIITGIYDGMVLIEPIGIGYIDAALQE